jgi:hypothetical protein
MVVVDREVLVGRGEVGSGMKSKWIGSCCELLGIHFYTYLFVLSAMLQLQVKSAAAFRIIGAYGRCGR